MFLKEFILSQGCDTTNFPMRIGSGGINKPLVSAMIENKVSIYILVMAK